ncbi:ISNCY family transposase, partial [Burkholderia ubonensis]|uniref:ISNCY family transposase n=1 Tax=Burkholderia ubonensis TaxID=101571 RepID=UPI0009B4A888
TATESTFSYFEATRAYLERYGKPAALYSDKASVFRGTSAGKTGRSMTHFGRAMYELNIDTFCANSSPAKGRVERAHLTLQDRLVKELRLRGISTVADANAYAPSFMAAYNARFAKPPRSEFNAHRPLRDDEDLDTLLTWRETRRVTKSLTVQYDRVMYLLDDTPGNRKLIHRYIDVWEYPDGRIEIRAEGRVLPCRQYDRLSEIDQGAIVEHKRLSHVLQVAQVLQEQRDNRRASGSPSRTNQGVAVRKPDRQPGTKKQREFTQADVDGVIVELAQRRQTSKSPRKPGRQSAKDSGSDASALPVQTPSFDTA